MPSITTFLQENIGLALAASLVVVFFIFLWNILLQVQLIKFKKRNKELFFGVKAGNVEELLLKHTKDIKALDRDIQELYTISNQINTLAWRGYHKLAMVRFNPFKDVGGDQSFALAILDGKDNGVTISSLYTRQGAQVYCKSIIAGKSEKHPLTKEEEQAIKLAMQPETDK